MLLDKTGYGPLYRTPMAATNAHPGFFQSGPWGGKEMGSKNDPSNSRFGKRLAWKRGVLRLDIEKKKKGSPTLTNLSGK